MAVGKRKHEAQQELWIPTQDLPRVASHPFYRKLNEVLEAADFDRKVEALAEPYYSQVKVGRKSLPPGVYVRMLLIGYFEDIDSERGIAWRCADSLAVREFLGYRLADRTPDHSTVSGTRRRLPLEWHEEVFALVSAILVEKGLIKGNTIAVDASTMEANAAMRAIVRRDTKLTYDAFVKRLAADSGVKTPTAAELKQFDRTRRKKTSNRDWESPTDPDAKITRLKDGRTRLGYKVEHAVDAETGAILDAEVHAGDAGDTTTGPETLDRTQFTLAQMKDHVATFETTRAEVVADKGYFKSAWLADLERNGYCAYIAEPKLPRRRWTTKRGVLTPEKAAQKKAVYGNRRRTRGNRGRLLMRKRAELDERSFAHMLDTGGMRRTWLRGRANVSKRYKIQAAAFNLALVMRSICGFGKPRGLPAALARLVLGILAAMSDRMRRVAWFLGFRRFAEAIA